MCDKGSGRDMCVLLGTLCTYDLTVHIIERKITSLFKYIYTLPWLREYVLISERETSNIFFSTILKEIKITPRQGKLGQGKPYLREMRTLVWIRITLNIIKKLLNSIIYTCIYILNNTRWRMISIFYSVNSVVLRHSFLCMKCLSGNG
jgi:hypothetical protein